MRFVVTLAGINLIPDGAECCAESHASGCIDSESHGAFTVADPRLCTCG